MSFIVTPRILLPVSSIDKQKWAVIACDQFTSEPEYWDELKSLVDNVPSTYHLILPEAYLDNDMKHKIEKVNQTMRLYLRNNLFEEHESFILIERKTPFVKRRLGLIIAIDLEEYEYEPNKNGKIVATEKTVPERIPPRVTIRENAPIELPHVITLVDDSKDLIINELYANRKKYNVLYDFDLNMNGGHIKGYEIKDTKPIIERLEKLSEKLNYVVGDGNHSLASAKVCWENIKKTLPEDKLKDNPARYALVELISLYDEGLTFEPIHRVIFNANEKLIEELSNILHGTSEMSLYFNDREIKINVPENPFICIRTIQEFLDDYLKKHLEATIDFVHGLNSLKTVTKKHHNSLGITMPPLKRDMLLPYIRENGVLPRKSFSLGEAEEKRYYLEGKKIL